MSKKAVKVLNQVLPKVPSLDKQPNYFPWLRYVCEAPENRTTLACIDKATVDTEFEKLLSGSPNVGDAGRYMDQTKSKQAMDAWKSYIKRIDTKAKPLSISHDVAQLALPVVGRHHKDDSKGAKQNNAWRYQTYKDFAKKVEKQNPQVEFNKTLMDEAFKLAAHRAFLRVKVAADQKELARCLGKESTKYWEDRDDEAS